VNSDILVFVTVEVVKPTIPSGEIQQFSDPSKEGVI